MARKFQIKRGLKVNMPELAQGELAMTTDVGSEGVFIGTGTGDPIELAKKTDLAGLDPNFTETDPTVPAWAKEATKPTYTADEVGAISSICERKDSGDITDLLGGNSARYIVTDAVTGMPFEGEWWFVDFISSSSTDAVITVYPIDIEDNCAKMYVKTCVNSTWSNWRRIYSTNDGGEFIVDGNIKGDFVTGEWLRTTSDTHLDGPAEKIAVLDGSGWIYHRTPAEALSDMGGAPAAKEFDLATMGMSAIPMDGSAVTLTTDVTAIRTALSKGDVKFTFQFQYSGTNLTASAITSPFYLAASDEYQVVFNTAIQGVPVSACFSISTTAIVARCLNLVTSAQLNSAIGTAIGGSY